MSNISNDTVRADGSRQGSIAHGVERWIFWRPTSVLPVNGGEEAYLTGGEPRRAAQLRV